MSASEPVNLVMVYAKNALDVEDFEKIARRIKKIANHIQVYIHLDEQPGPEYLSELEQRKTFVFSPMQLTAFSVNRGRVCAGRPMQKSEQLLRLQLAGVPVPKWTSLDRGKRFNPEDWGEYVVIKPEIGSRARGVKILDTKSLNINSSKIMSFRRQSGNFVVQEIIYNRIFSHVRILMLFSEVLFARQCNFLEDVRFDTEADMRNYERLFMTDNTETSNYESEEVFALARRCVACFDQVPMLGLDVMLDEAGKPYFLEANPGGNTWHFSSAIRGQRLRKKGIFLETQFDAFNLAGDILAQKTIELAI